VEENVLAGGFGSAVSEMLDASGIAVPQLRLGVPNEFVLHGKRDELLKQVGLDAEGIARRTLEFVRQSRHQYT
jgi:1-deoxy-D-xylulose-5-phosphate synthase